MTLLWLYTCFHLTQFPTFVTLIRYMQFLHYIDHLMCVYKRRASVVIYLLDLRCIFKKKCKGSNM